MKKLITATGKQFDCDWCGVSFMGQLFAAIANSDFGELLRVFGNADETQTLTFDDDGQTQTYEGYTVFIGMQYDPRTGFITVNLAKGV